MITDSSCAGSRVAPWVTFTSAAWLPDVRWATHTRYLAPVVRCDSTRRTKTPCGCTKAKARLAEKALPAFSPAPTILTIGPSVRAQATVPATRIKSSSKPGISSSLLRLENPSGPSFATAWRSARLSLLPGNRAKRSAGSLSQTFANRSKSPSFIPRLLIPWSRKWKRKKKVRHPVEPCSEADPYFSINWYYSLFLTLLRKGKSDGCCSIFLTE
mmetsp:Transcript_32523/g.79150  ORF Transcript_32523/g.79150 Transcript_32523/m.79150 type:complete len:214 (+) Transcript_32523:643-1284(+)